MKTAVKIWGVSFLLLTLMAPPGYAKMQHDMAMAAIPNMQCFGCTGADLIHGGLAEGALAFVDSDSTYVNVPEQLLWADYIKTTNADCDNPHTEYELTVIDCTLYIIADDLVGALPWMLSADPDVGGAVFEDTGLDITVRPEFAADHTCSIWAARLGPGTYTLGPQNNGMGNMYGIAAVTHPLALLSMYPNADGTGAPALYTGHYNLAVESSKYYNSGHEMPDGSYTRYYYSGPAQARETLELIVDRYEHAEAGQGSRTLAAAQYNDKNQIVQIEQVNKDPAEPNNVLTFQYDQQARVTTVELTRGSPTGQLISTVSLSDYCNRCPYCLRSRPRRVEYSDPADPNKTIEINSTYDLEGNLASLTYNRHEYSHIGHFSFSHDPNGRVASMNYNVDEDSGGNYWQPVLNATFSYDANDKLVRIYDTVSDSNILEWDRTGDTENIKVRSIIGNPAVDTINVGTVDASFPEGKIITLTIGGSQYVQVTVPDDNGLPVSLRNWDWCSDCQPSNKVSADVSWARLDANLGDPNISDRLVLPVLDPNGRLEATVSAKKKGIGIYGLKGFTYKIYKDRQDVRGIGIGVTYTHQADDGSILSVLTVDESGNVRVGIGGGADELMDIMFFNSWTGCGPRAGDIGEYDDFMGESASPYLIGVITPEGIYHSFQYDSAGNIEAIIRFNDVLEADCTQEIDGDVNGDCRVDFWDFAVMAADWLQCNLDPPTACWD